MAIALGEAALCSIDLVRSPPRPKASHIFIPPVASSQLPWADRNHQESHP